MTPSNYQLLIEHLWQSTLFGIVCVGLIFLFRKGSSSSRCIIAWAAIIKFLAPFHLVSVCFNALPGLPRPSMEITNTELLRPLRAPPGIQVDASLSNQPVESIAPPIEESNSALFTTPGLLWLLGYSVLSLCWIQRSFKSYRLRKETCVHADVKWGIMADRLWTRWDRATPRVLIANGDSFQPGVFGLLNPVIVIPRTLSESLNDQESEQLLRHELAHAAKRDPFWLFVQRRIRDLFWFHPLVWWLDQRINLLREILRDEEVIEQTQNKKIYLDCLLKASVLVPSEGLNTSVGFKGSSFSKRIAAITRFEKNSIRDARASIASIAAIGICCVLLGLSVANAIIIEEKDPMISVFGEKEAYFIRRAAEIEKLKAIEGNSIRALGASEILAFEKAFYRAKSTSEQTRLDRIEETNLERFLELYESDRYKAKKFLVDSLNEGSDPVLYYLAGNLYAESDDAKTAFKYYLIAYGKTFTPPVNVSSEIDASLAERGIFETALPYYQKAIYHKDNDKSDIHLLLSFIHSKLLNSGDADYLYKRAAETALDAKDWSLTPIKAQQIRYSEGGKVIDPPEY